MDPQRPKIPPEAVDLYTQFIHGEVNRRDFLSGVKRFAIGGLTTAAIIEALMPNYALGQQVSKEDERIRASDETLPSPDGNGYIRGYLVRPFSADSRSEVPAQLPGVIVIHENRGLNPHTEDVARRFALAGFMAFAPDALTTVGGYPGDDYEGGQLFRTIDREKMTADFVAAARWLKSRPDCNGRIAATGFCFGGGMSNTLAVLLGPDLAAWPVRAAAISSGVALQCGSRCWARTCGSCWPATRSRRILSPVRPTMSLTTSGSWRFISTRLFCIRRT